MFDMQELLGTSKMKHLVTYKVFCEKVMSMRISPEEKVKRCKAYSKFINTKPKRTDFVNFDDEGFYLDDNKTLFKGFICDEEAGDDNVKVPMFNNVRVYIADNDIVIMSFEHVSDNAWTYEHFAHFFNKDNNQEPLLFNV